MRSLSDASQVVNLDRRLAALTADRPAVWGVMTAHQMVTHLRDSMRGASNGLVLKTVPSALRGPAGRYFALRSGIQWPRNVKTVPELELRGVPKPDVALFAGDLAGLREQLGSFAGLEGGRLSPVHPMMGQMTREDWMCWGYLHADHHLRQFGC